MTTAKCNKCGASATGSDFAVARSKINHASGLSRGVHCGDNYNQVYEIKPPSSQPNITKPISESVVEDKVETKVETKTEKPKTEKSKKSKFRIK